MEETQLGQSYSPVPGSEDLTILEQYGPTPDSPSSLLSALSLVLSPENQQFLDTNFMLLNKIRNGQIIQIVFHQNKTPKII